MKYQYWVDPEEEIIINKKEYEELKRIKSGLTKQELEFIKNIL